MIRMSKCPVFNQPAEPPQPTIRHELAHERLQVGELQARVDELEEELASARTIYNAGSTLSDDGQLSRTVCFEQCYEAPRRTNSPT
jgi:hypothetical protein